MNALTHGGWARAVVGKAAPAGLACRGMLAPDGASASPPSPETGARPAGRRLVGGALAPSGARARDARLALMARPSPRAPTAHPQPHFVTSFMNSPR